MVLYKLFNELKRNNIKTICTKIKNRIINIYYLYEIDLDTFNNNCFEDKDYEFISITEEILSKLEKDKMIPTSKIKILRDRVENMNEILDYVVLNKKEQIMGHFSIALENSLKNPYINKYLKFSKETTYFFDSYTIEKYRRKGVQKFALIQKIKISKNLGYKKSIILTFSSNFPAQKAFESVGMIKKSKIYELRILGKKMYERKI